MDISNYLLGIANNITNKTQKKSISGTTVGQSFVDLATLTKTAIDALPTTTNVNLKANISDLTQIKLLSLSNFISGGTVYNDITLSGKTVGIDYIVKKQAVGGFNHTLSATTEVSNISTGGFRLASGATSTDSFEIFGTLGTLSNYISQSQFAGVLGTPVLVNYSKDFTSLINTANNLHIYATNTPLTSSGYLSSLRINAATGTSVNVFAYNIALGTGSTIIPTLLYSYPAFTVFATATTISFTDNFLIPSGSVIAVKTTGNYYFANNASGNFDITNNTTTITNVAYDYIVNSNVINGISQRITALEDSGSYTKSQIDVILGIPVLANYSKDFSVLNSFTTGNGFIYAANTPLTSSGYLTSVRVNASPGSQVSVFAYNIIPGTGSTILSTLLHSYTPFTIATSAVTQTINDNFIVPSGSVIAVTYSGGFYFANTATGYFNITNSATTITNTAFDYVINTNTNIGIENNVASNSTSISGLTNRVTALETGALKIGLKPTILYRNTGSALSGITSTGWTTVSGGVSPTVTGATNNLWLQKEYHINPRNLNIETTLSSDSVFVIETAPINYYTNNGLFVIDVPNKNLIVYDKASDGTLTQEAISAITFNFVSGRKYAIQVSLVDWSNIFSIEDTVNGQSFSMTYTNTTSLAVVSLNQMESYKFYLNKGIASGVTLSLMNVGTKYKPLVLLMGDSITQGLLFNASDFNSRYPILLRNALNGNVIISARGGATIVDVNNTLITEAPFIKPDYIMLTIGTNASFSSSVLTSTINTIISLGAVPIVNHVPNRTDGSHIATNATIDSVCQSTGAIRGALFDVATSINNDPTQSYIVANYFGDGVHPNALGHQAMFARFAIDLPFLFS